MTKHAGRGKVRSYRRVPEGGACCSYEEAASGLWSSALLVCPLWLLPLHALWKIAIAAIPRQPQFANDR